MAVKAYTHSPSICTANIVLEDTIERIYVGNTFGDIPLGVFLVRGENVVLLGEVVRHRIEPHTHIATSHISITISRVAPMPMMKGRGRDRSNDIACLTERCTHV